MLLRTKRELLDELLKMDALATKLYARPRPEIEAMAQRLGLQAIGAKHELVRVIVSTVRVEGIQRECAHRLEQELREEELDE